MKNQQKYQIEQVATADLIPYARNAKKHDAAQVAKIAGSIREFGFNNPVLIDAENGIIAGHGRIMAAQKLGMESVPCLRLSHLTDAQRKAYILADNRLAEIGGGWDEKMLLEELRNIQISGIHAEAIGFSDDDISELAAALEADDETANEIKPEKLPKAIQLEPPKEYAVIMCENEEEWEKLKVALNLKPVRRGGYKQGSAFDAVGTQRVVKASQLIERLNDNSDTK